MGIFSKLESAKPDINLISQFSNLIGNLIKIRRSAAISGHVTLREVERYVKMADQERLARAAIGGQR
jgi:hypothetical protein